MKRPTVTRLRGTPGGRDHRTGDRVESTVTRSDLHLVCPPAPRYEAGEPRQQGRNGVVVGLTIYAVPGSDVDRKDQVEIDGVVYDVEGEPGKWDGTRVGGVEVALRRAVG